MVIFRLLGGTSLVGSRATDPSSLLSRPKSLAVLAFLALKGRDRYLRRDVLAGVFWPESDHAHARNALNQVLHEVRRELGQEILHSRGKDEVGLSSEMFQCDVWSFQDALDEGDPDRALAEYRGDLLPGLFLNGNRDFENWLEMERERLRELAAGAAWASAHACISRGELVQAERTAQKALSLVWSDETPVRRFIAALAEAGDRSSAVWFYEKFCHRLREELELEPSPETVALVEEVRGRSSVEPPDFGKNSQGARPASPGEYDPDPLREVRDEGRQPGRAVSRGRPVQVWAAWGAFALVLTSILAVLPWPGEEWEPDPRVVAVAPFQNRTGDPDLDGLGDLLAAGIQFRLDRGSLGEVASHPMVEQTILEAGPGANAVRVLAREMGAGVVVTGDIYLHGDSLVARAHCTDAVTGTDIHPLPPVVVATGDESTMVALIQDRVASVLAQHFDAEFSLEPDLAPPPSNLEAYQEYRRGFEAYKLGGSHGEAIPHFQRAWELDPEYLEPALVLLHRYSRRPDLNADYGRILARLEESRVRMTPYQRHFFDGIRMAGEREQELAYREFLAMAALGRLRAAAALAEKALWTNRPAQAVEAAGWLEKDDGNFLEPWVAFWQGYWSQYTYGLHLTGRYRKELEIALEWEERFPSALYYPVQARAKALIGLGKLDELDSILEDWRAEGRLEGIWDLADELRVHGHEAKAMEILEGEVERFETAAGYKGRFNNQAMVLHRLGRNGEAHILWEKGIDLGRPDPWPWGVARIGFSAALIGDTAQAKEMESLLVSLPEPQEAYTGFLQAQIAAGLGEKDRAVRLLDTWTREGSIPFWLNNLHRDYTLQQLLGDHPPFHELLRPKG